MQLSFPIHDANILLPKQSVAPKGIKKKKVINDTNNEKYSLNVLLFPDLYPDAFLSYQANCVERFVWFEEDVAIVQQQMTKAVTDSLSHLSCSIRVLDEWLSWVFLEEHNDTDFSFEACCFYNQRLTKIRRDHYVSLMFTEKYRLGQMLKHRESQNIRSRYDYIKRVLSILETMGYS
ncbi:hypothetical protein [Vibrio tritonius]|uniref:hypothetical protein n=1 Tax=Vibrio tritonius TaxID=1435069 RepID=UPI00315CB50E